MFGPIADVVNPNRTNRYYRDELWEKAFDSPLISEQFECGGLFLELDHPTDRDETCSERIAAVMPEKPKKGEDGKLYAQVDILDTPLGRIANILARYGFKLGISSRGSGEVKDNFDGTEDVVPDEYELKAFDLVLLPSVKEARLKLITESLDLKKNLNEELKEVLDSANEVDKKVMLETLQNFNIPVQTNSAAKESGATKKLVEQLTSSLKEKLELEKTVSQLQESLSVSATKEKELEDKLQLATLKVRKAVKLLNNEKETVRKLTEQVNISKVTSDKTEELTEALKSHINQLTRTIKVRESDLAKLQQQLKLEKTKLSETKTELSKTKAETVAKEKATKAKSKKAKQIIEHYQQQNDQLVKEYIRTQATLLGVSEQDIKNRLNENFTVSELVSVCNNMKTYKLNISTLPFNIANNSRVKLTESKNYSLDQHSPYDDDVNDLLQSL